MFKKIYLQDIPAGIISGFYVVIVAVSCATLIFGGVNQAYISFGITLSLLSSLLINLYFSCFKINKFSIGIVDIASGAILAIILQHIALHTQASSFLPTAIAAIIIASMSLGVSLYLLGKFNLGHYIRYLPYPVIGGFLAGIGWLVLLSGIAIVINGEPTFYTIFNSHHYLQLIISLLLATLLIVITRLWQFGWILPIFLLVTTLLLHLIFYLVEIPPFIVKQWFLSDVEDTLIWQVIKPSMIYMIDWKLILEQINYFLAIIAINSLSLLLSINSLEVIIQEKLELNTELKKSGLLNLICGAVGTFPVIVSITGVLLNIKSGAKSRLSLIIAALTCAFVLFVNPHSITMIPRAIIGGLIIFMAGNLLIEWVFDIWKRLPITDSLTVIAILLTMAFFGLTSGIIVGILITCATFIINYTRLSSIKYELTGNIYHSKVVRPASQQHKIMQQGECIRIYKLQGYLFFGSTKLLVEKITQLLGDKNSSQLKFIIFDFQLVNDIDSSTVFNFQRLLNVVTEKNVQLIMTALTEKITTLLRKNNVINTKSYVHLFNDLDHGLEWCENKLLASDLNQFKTSSQTFGKTLSDYIPNSLEQKTFISYLEKFHLPSNTILIQQDSSSDSIYFIESGETSIFYQSTTSIIRLLRSGSGTIIGEIGFFLGTNRTATVKTETDCSIYKLTRHSMQKMKIEHPEIALNFYSGVIRVLAERVKQADEEIGILSR